MAKLTERSIKKLPRPSTGAYEVSDDLLPNLVLRVHSTGGYSWCVRYRVKGRRQQRRLTLGRWPALRVEKARELGADFLRRVAKGDDPQGDRSAAQAAERTGELTDGFVDQARRFVETYARPQNKSWLAQARLLGLSLNKAARRNSALERHWAIIPGSPADRWKKRTVGSLTKREIVEAVDAATERGPIVANRVHATLTRFFSWAVEKGVIEVSPTLGTKAPNPERSRDRVLSREELSDIWHAAGELRAPFSSFVRLLILTAARRNEVSGMTAAELTDGAWTIPASRAKQAEANMLPLPRQALEIIAELPRSASGLLFTTTGKTPISGFSKMKRELDRVLAEGRKVAPWTLHDLRRSAATGMASLGIEPHIVEAILGHRSGVISGIAAVYNKFTYSSEKKDALQRWADDVDFTTMVC
jgi:site-specific recombinase XerD